METTKIDEVDFRIVNELVQNGRISFARLGEAVGLSPHGAADRVRRLQRAGVIKGFTATVDLERVGRALDAFIDVRLRSDTPPDRFEAYMRTLPPVREVAFVTGRFDYHVRVACGDADELDATIRAIRGDGGAAETETRIVLRSASWLHPVGQ